MFFYLLKTLKLSIKGLATNKTRTFLSIIGIVIGVASVIVIVSVGQGLKSLIVNQISAFGSNIMTIETKIPESDFGGSHHISMVSQGVIITTLKESDAIAIRDKKKFPYVDVSSAYSVAQEWAKYKEKEKRVLIVGTDSYYTQVDGQMKIDKGRFINKYENENLSKVVVIGSDVAYKFFKNEDPIGKKIKIKQVSFKVIGVLKSRGTVMTFNMDEVVVIPLRAVQKFILGTNYILEIGIKLKDEKYFPQAKKEIEEILRKRHGIENPKSDDFYIVTMNEVMETVGTITTAISVLLGILAAVSLLVGGVGIMNIMLVSAVERTKEIGLRKTLGARNSDILLQFLFESSLISFLGGILGIIFGIFISLSMTIIVNSYGFDWPFVISVSAVIISFFISAAFGIIFGWYPAQKAAKLNPIESLRYE